MGILFEHEDEFEDDLSVPNETIIYYSRINIYAEMIIGILIVIFGIYGFYTKDYLPAIVFIPFGIYVIYREQKKAKNTNPQIILNKDGIEICTMKFSKWSNVRELEIVDESNVDSREYFLRYETKYGKASIKIDDLDTHPAALRKLIHVYIYRNKQRKH